MSKNNKKKFSLNKKDIAFIALLGLPLLNSGYKTIQNLGIEEISFKEFKSYLKTNDVEEITIKNETLDIKLKDGTLLKSYNPNSDESRNIIGDADIKVKNALEFNFLDLTNIVMTAFLISLIYKQISNGKKVDKSTGKTSLKFSDIAGNEEAKQELMDIAFSRKSKKQFEHFKATAKKGILLHGPSGTGKTALAKALATECDAHFIAVSSSVFANKFLGGGADKVRSIFKEAKEHQPSIIFIDEIDGIGHNRDSKDSHDEYRKTLNELLVCMDGFEENDIIVIGATNRLHSLDEALLRPGRFDSKIYVPLPNISEREEIFKLYAEGRPIDNDIDWKEFARMTSHFSGAAIKNVMNTASIYAIKDNAESISRHHISRAINTEMTGEEKKNRAGISDKDKELTAYHEAGHAIVGKLIANINIPKVSIIPTTNGAGGYTLIDTGESPYASKKELLNQIAIALGGRIAEEIIYGKENVTTGASEDIKRATHLAKTMISELGMSDAFGMVYLQGIPEMELTVLQEVNKMITDIYNSTYKFLSDRANLLEETKNALLEMETIHEDELNAIIEAFNI